MRFASPLELMTPTIELPTQTKSTFKKAGSLRAFLLSISFTLLLVFLTPAEAAHGADENQCRNALSSVQGQSAPTKGQLLGELAELRMSFDSALANGGNNVARLLAKDFARKMEQALSLNISAREIAERVEELRANENEQTSREAWRVEAARTRETVFSHYQVSSNWSPGGIKEILSLMGSQIIVKTVYGMIETIDYGSKQSVWSWVAPVQLNPDDSIFMSQASDKALIVQAASAASPILKNLKLGHNITLSFIKNGNVSTASFDRSGTRIGLGMYDGALKIIDAETGAVVSTLKLSMLR